MLCGLLWWEGVWVVADRGVELGGFSIPFVGTHCNISIMIMTYEVAVNAVDAGGEHCR